MLRHVITIAQETGIKFKTYKGPNDDDPSILKMSTVSHSEVLAVQGQSSNQKIHKVPIRYKM